VLGKCIGSGKEAEIFEYGDLVVKLYRSTAPKRAAFREAAIITLIESLGLPVPSVRAVQQFEGRWGVTMTRAESPSPADAVSRERLRDMASLHLRVHGHPGLQFAGLKARLALNIQLAEALSGMQKERLLAGLAAQPEGDRLCHGDFHPFNILGARGQEVIVDWPSASCGDPLADVCRSYVLLKPSFPELASHYVEVYAEMSGASRDRIFSWLPFVSAARLAEGVPDEVAGLLAMIQP
jgi:Phosphotransferase enzyme family